MPNSVYKTQRRLPPDTSAAVDADAAANAAAAADDAGDSYAGQHKDVDADLDEPSEPFAAGNGTAFRSLLT
ncbi:hypothetical protein AWZ03_002909 [Drosophila navojoa]|uniref:Uncharacterized protein n=1 Tax=Drosophila navojoa TaxID=7232 RepID=A0A484BS00_DRONA|nr:hypothetical protein AWZ03_002909 [Drosophila navojoa]